MSMNEIKNENLVDFSKHVPKLLHHQLINEQSHLYIKSENNNEASISLNSSVQRIHGALLFIDISGFTVLSQKLDVESLKNHINDYFSKIIEIVDRWGGDVVKFAGDALYVVWRTNIKLLSTDSQTTRSNGSKSGRKVSQSGSLASSRSSAMLSSGSNSQFRYSALEITEKAVQCGLEICYVCSNFPVNLVSKDLSTKQGEPTKLHQKITSIVSSIASRIVTKNTTSNDAVTYLNVHCGVSVGLMAGLDVGYEDRWEYFLIGEALADVAKAESAAEKGDVVISAVAHELFHCPEKYGSNMGTSGVLPCGCKIVGEGCYKLLSTDELNLQASQMKNARDGNNPKARRSKTSANLENYRLLENLSNEVKSALSLITTSLKKEYVTTAAQFVQTLQLPNLDGETAINQELKRVQKQLPAFIVSHVRRHFNQWIKSRLLDHLARHVHDVARADYSISNDLGLTFRSLLLEFLTRDNNFVRGPSIESVRPRLVDITGVSGSISPITPSVDNEANELDDIFDPEIIFKAPTSMSGKERLNSKVEAELRTVTVMFIKIETFDLSLLIDCSRCKEGKRPIFNKFDSIFGFLERTENEQMADQIILDQVQKCLAVLHRCIYGNGGQLRQFIVDDKGTVGIASFGLRGSVNEDNAALAVEAANAVVEGLRDIDLIASIGITTGKVYCGLVGSKSRHEFALMGPSVNLSARLMSKAGQHSILCDHETMIRDRTHQFKHLNDVQAKGYSHPVATYKPIILTGVMYERGELVRGMSLSSLTPLMNGIASQLAVDTDIPLSSNGLVSTVNGGGHLGSQSSVPADWNRNRKLEKIATSDFFITDEPVTLVQETVGGTDNIQISSGGYRPLRGRNQEIGTLLRFLLADNCEDQVLVDIDAACRIAAVIGLNGFGKTAIVSTMTRNLSSLSREDSAINLTVIKPRMKHSQNTTRLSVYKPLLVEVVRMVKKAMDTSVDAKASIRNGARLQASVRRVIARADPRLEYCSTVESIFKQLPESAQPYKKVVLDSMEAFASTVTPANDKGACKKGYVVKHSMEEYKVAMLTVMNYYVSLAKKAMVIVIENFNSLDSFSSDIVMYLWSQGKGFHFLLTANVESSHMTVAHSTRDDASNRKGTLSNETSKMDVFTVCRSNNRFLQIVLEPLPASAIGQIIKDIIPGDVTPSVIDQLVSASGGNPMYATQLAKTVAEEGTEVLGSNHVQSAARITHLATMSRRVEEMICYRLDRLGSLSQSILKAATVCALNGRSFTPDLIAYVIHRLAKSTSSVLGISSEKSSTPTTSISASTHSYNSVSSPSMALSTQNMHAFRELVNREMTSMYQRGDFLQICFSSMDSLPQISTLTEDDNDIFGSDPMENDSNVNYEFQIPTEQSTIYALIIDEQREDFHSKVAQYYHEKWNPNEKDGLEPDERTKEGIAPRELMVSIQEDVKELAFHALRAGLWTVAMRSFMQAAEMELSLENDSKARMSLLLDAFHTFKCYEQDANEVIAPFADLMQLLMPNEKTFGEECKEPLNENILQKVLLSKGNLPLEDIVMLNRRFEKELDCVYNMFGNDTASMLLAAELHLNMVDMYMHSMNTHEQEPVVSVILGIVMKLFLAIRLCITLGAAVKDVNNLSDDVFFAGYSKMVNTRDIDQHCIARFLVDFLMMQLTSENVRNRNPLNQEKLDCMLEKIGPFLNSLSKPTTTLNSQFRVFDAISCAHHSAGSLTYQMMRLFSYLRKGDLVNAVAEWRQTPFVSNAHEANHYVKLLGNEYSLMTTTKLLHQLTTHVLDTRHRGFFNGVKGEQDSDVNLFLCAIDQCIERAQQQLFLWFEPQLQYYRHYYQHLVMSLLPGICALICLERWDILDKWFAVLIAINQDTISTTDSTNSFKCSKESNSNIDEFHAPPQHCVKHLFRWYQAMKIIMTASSATSYTLPSSFPYFSEFQECVSYFQTALNGGANSDVLAVNAPSKAVCAFLRSYGLAPEMLVQLLLLLVPHFYPKFADEDIVFARLQVIVASTGSPIHAVPGISASNVDSSSLVSPSVTILNSHMLNALKRKLGK